MRIYRIEDKVGDGMYWSKYTGHLPLPSKSERHPMPEDDSLLRKNMIEAGFYDSFWGSFDLSGLIFGFSSAEQLRNWLYDDDLLRSLSDAGLMLSIYDISEKYLLGHTQVVFERGECVEKHNIKEFFNL